MDIEQNLATEGAQLQYVNRLAQQYAGHNRIIVSWTVFSPAGAIKHELVYYRDWQRLDYQAWNLADAKRVRRVLWRQISAEQMKTAAASGAGQFPGNREVYE
jgi:hypothetical protein